MDDIVRRHTLSNRRRWIYDLKRVPREIHTYHKVNKNLTKVERFLSAFLQSCIRYGYVKSYRSQQIIQLGISEKFIMADFFLHWPEAIIEVDGPEHKAKEDGERDKKVLELFAYTTLRVSNGDVTQRNKETRDRLIRGLAKLEGLSDNQIKRRIKEYWKKRSEEGY